MRGHPADRMIGLAERHLWDAYARVYDALLDLTGYQDLLRRVSEIADVRPGQTVVEVGCGTGNVLQRMSSSGATRLIGLDASASMLARARNKLTRTPDLTLVRTDAVSGLASLPEGSVDRLVAVNFLYVMPDRQAFWREAARVLAPGGSVVAAHTDRPGSGPLLREHLGATGWRGLFCLRLWLVAAFDVVIDVLAGGGRYHFCGFETLADEAADSGLLGAQFLGRCYGGPVEGVDILVRFTADPVPGAAVSQHRDVA